MAGKRPKARRHYSDDEKAAALAALAANAGNVGRTAALIGVPEPTLRQWARGHRAGAPAQLNEQKKADLATLFKDLAADALGVARGKMGEATFQQLLTGAGIAVDKALLLGGKPTTIANATVSFDLASLRKLPPDELLRLHRRTLGLPREGGPDG